MNRSATSRRRCRQVCNPYPVRVADPPRSAPRLAPVIASCTPAGGRPNLDETGGPTYFPPGSAATWQSPDRSAPFWTLLRRDASRN